MQINTPVSSIPYVGTHFANRLKKLEIRTVRDLIFYFPTRYQDLRATTIKGKILSIKNVYTRSGKKIQQAEVWDGKSKINVVWFNQPFLIKTLPVGTQVSLSGKIETRGGKKTLVSPEYEKAPGTLHTGRLVPIYPETYGITSRWLRARIANVLPSALPQINEFLPTQILNKYKLLGLRQAIEKIHFPKNQDDIERARQRLAFDELFEIQILSCLRRKRWKTTKVAQKLVVPQEKILDFIASLPFSLTPSQKRAIREILEDLGSNQPMNRLLQGDVGSGKTVVAAIACYVSFLNGYQSAIMAPTQILAQQHYKTLEAILKPFGVKIELKISSQTRSKSQISKLENADVIVGTQSLIQKGVAFEKLALVVIDEQHRFGVLQRALLTKKGGQTFSPHVLTMTATPIPRTVALVIYGDLDLSTLDELPVGRIPVKTWVVPPQKREAAYEWIRKRVQNTDEQAFIVCPLIEESEKESMKQVRAATAEFERLSKKVFPDLRLALLHGKTKAQEKEMIMEKMKKGEIDILVATPVVEVGIDIPNATIMMIEGAERFGLAQLHQLRGRVGRGSKQSYCLLFSESTSRAALMRLKSMEKTLSGAQLAEIDLKLRGPGEIFGTAQHGFPKFKVASLADSQLIKMAQEAASALVDKINFFPSLQNFIKEKEAILTS